MEIQQFATLQICTSANLQASKGISDTTLDILKQHNKLSSSNILNTSAVSGSQKRKRKSTQQTKTASDINKHSSWQQI